MIDIHRCIRNVIAPFPHYHLSEILDGWRPLPGYVGQEIVACVVRGWMGWLMTDHREEIKELLKRGNVSN